MTRNNKWIAVPTLLILISLYFTACQFNGVKGSGNTVSENRPVTGEFQSIEVGNGLDVEIEQASTTGIMVIADDNLQTHIKTRIENGVLKISSDVNNYVNVESKKVVVKSPKWESIEVREGSSLESKNTIKAANLNLKSKTGSTVRIVIECEKAMIEATEAGVMTVEGKAIALETAATTGGKIDAEKLLSNEITASASTAGNITVNPLVSLSADATTGGCVNYVNLPKNLNKKSTTGGSINKK